MIHRHLPYTLFLAAVLAWLGSAAVHRTAADGERSRSDVYQSTPTRVAEGLANPRGIVVTAEGAIYVAEAGVGGEGPCFEGPEGEVCFGHSGAVTRIDATGPVRVVEDLPSLAGEGGAFTTGAHGVVLASDGTLVVSIGLGADPAVRDDLLADAGLGTLWRADLTTGVASPFVDLAAFEAAENPDGTMVDSNPYGIATSGSAFVVADAGGNAVLIAHADGSVETLAVIDPLDAPALAFMGMPDGATLPMESVPTAVAIGADGAVYVGVLTGFPFPVGGASVYRIEPGALPMVYASGFSTIIDLAFGPDGALYVLELTTNGLLAAEFDEDLRGARHRVEDGVTTVVMGADDGLVAPGGIAFGPDGDLYVTNLSVFPFGEVLRVGR